MAMTLASQTIEQLKSLGPLHGRRETLRVEQEGVRVECDLVAADSLSCSFSELRLEVPGHVDDEADALNHWADALSRRVTYLLEGLERLETDVESGTVMLRSSPPEKTAEHTHYYELLLQRGGHLRLRRYRTGPEGGRRAEVACTCTHEQVAKLVDDLVRSAREA
jgi:hypothetical protein